MRDIMRMDLILNRNYLLVNGGIFGAFLLYMVWEGPSSPIVYAVFSSIWMCFLPVTIVTREDKAKATALACSLPVTRRTIVLSRYVLAFAMTGTGLALAWSLAAWLPGSVMSPAILFRSGPVHRWASHRSDLPFVNASCLNWKKGRTVGRAGVQAPPSPPTGLGGVHEEDRAHRRGQRA